MPPGSVISDFKHMQVLCSGNQEPILVGSLSVYQRQWSGFLSINQSSYVTCTWRCTVKFVLWVAGSSRSAAPEEADPDLRQCLVSSTDWILSEDTCFVLFYLYFCNVCTVNTLSRLCISNKQKRSLEVTTRVCCLSHVPVFWGAHNFITSFIAKPTL